MRYINKLQKIGLYREANVEDDEKYYVKVIVDKDGGTLKFIDNGIGMTGDEVKKYINQVAFSGAKDFMEKYQDKVDSEGEIIGYLDLVFILHLWYLMLSR